MKNWTEYTRNTNNDENVGDGFILHGFEKDGTEIGFDNGKLYICPVWSDDILELPTELTEKLFISMTKYYNG